MTRLGGKKLADSYGERDGLYRASGFVAEAVSTGKRKGEGELDEATVYWRYAGEEGKVEERREIESLPRYEEGEDAAAHRDDVMASEEKKARRQRQEEEENANKTEKEEAEPATADEQLNLDKKPEDDILEEERWKREQNDSSEGTNDTNTGEDGVMSSEISIKFPEQTAQIRHIFRKAEGHLADTPVIDREYWT